MKIDKKAIQDRLRKADFTGVFTQELGWDFPPGNLTITIAGQQFQLQAVAEKKGLVAYVCPAQSGQRLPDYATRRKIEREVTKHRHQHLIVFTDASKSTQVWQWVKRELGKPAACREHTYHVGQPGDALIQKLTAVAVSLQEEESLTHVEVTGKVKKAFDVEKVTKRFYDRFQKEHQAFLKLLKGIPDGDMQRWYVSVMLNRLMFIYFIQSKGFLGDADRDYLRTKLVESKLRGKDRYYRDFLCPLFFEGFAKRKGERSPKMNDLLGTVPYLNGGLFLRHQIEELHGEEIRIPDAAFEKLFEFFHGYHWHLDERPLKADNEINPDVLGYIFEKYINQKQMGAYYTKEDITEYIAKNTIIPFLFDATAKKCPTDFAADAELWRLLSEDPDRYIYPAVRRGVVDDEGNVLPESALPDFVRKGMHDPKARMFERRYNLGEANLQDAAGEKLTLPTETWREYVCRRQRCLELREKLRKGEVQSVNDLITLNLDIRQFAQDAIANCQSPELLAAFFESICTVTVLDPTCGSGAFLFAALNVLEPLYEACLDRMESFLAAEDAKAAAKGNGNGTKRPTAKAKCLADFRQTLKAVNDDHPNAKYFIFKSIIIRNLFGVDIMEEATEICKLRLFLKLVAQVDPDPSKPNLGVEPLPDIDFNIRAGNTLVGYTTIDEIRRSQKGKFGFNASEIARLETQAQAVADNFNAFRRMQTGREGSDFTPVDQAAAKQTLRRLQAGLADEINRYLAGDYGIDADNANKAKDFEKWRDSHRPFHWFVEFHGIMKAGGFDVLIGNPPYLETRQIDYVPRGFATYDSKAVHAMCIERSAALLGQSGAMSMIVPLAIVSTQRMVPVQRIIEAGRQVWYANFAWRPGKLFDTVNRALTIFVTVATRQESTFSTGYQKWNSDTRDGLMHRMTFTKVPHTRKAFWVPKLSESVEQQVLTKVLACSTTVCDVLSRTGKALVYHRTTGGLYWKPFTDFAPAFRINGKKGTSSRETAFAVANAAFVRPLIAALSSNLFWWWYTITSNLRDLNPSDIQGFPMPLASLTDPQLARLGTEYLEDLKANSTMLVREQKQTGRTETQCFKIQLSKSIIDNIDKALARHYGLDEAELDFIVNYDIKYRIGQVDGEGEDE